MLTQAVIDLFVRRGVNITQAQTTTDKTSPVAEVKRREVSVERRTTMIGKTSPALMIKKDDIEQLLLEWSGIPQWVKAHISTKYPPHRYEGDLAIESECLVFRGRDIKDGKDFEEVIPLDSIIGVFFDFDKQLEGSIDPSFGIGGPVPFVVRYQTKGREQTAYFNTYLSHYPIHIVNGNRKWYDTLKDITSHTPRRELKVEKDRVLVAAGVR